MTMRHLAAAPLLVVSLATLAIGCGQHQKDSPALLTEEKSGVEPPVQGPKVVKKHWPEEVPTHGLTKGMVLPLEKYMISYAEEIAVQQARDTIEIACMRRYGFTDWRTEDLGTSPPPADNASNMPRRYGLSDLAEAKEYGYHLPYSGIESTPPPEQDVPEAATVLHGRSQGEKVNSFKGDDLPDGGCVGEVNRKIPVPDMGLVERLNSESLESSQEAPPVKSAMAQWVSCMNARGYSVTTVWDTTEVVSTIGDTASYEEIKIATAEVECKQQADLVKIWFDEETRIQESLVKEHESVLRGAQVRQDESLRKSHSVIESARD